MTTTQRHAEVAGAGFAGLTVAIALARRGWSVRVHEQSDEVRDFGAGILIWRNAMMSLDAIGLADQIRAHATEPTYYATSLNGAEPTTELGGYPYWAITRPRLHAIMAHAARDAGVKIVTSSRAVGADPDGVLRLEDGSSYRADLVVGADGAGSLVRNSLPAFVQERKKYKDGVVRVLVPRSPEFAGAEWDSVIDYWTLEPDAMRILYVPCGPETVYMGMMAETTNERASRIPIDPVVWSERFPHLAPLIVSAEHAVGPRHDGYQTNRVAPWSTDRVVLVGDSAHAMCPALGQGASVGIVNAVALAHTLDEFDDLSEGLRTWESRERAMTDAAQARSAYMAETRTLAKGAGFTPEVMETANFVSVAISPEIEAQYPVPEVNRSW
ncbi:MAG TPA: NAD(P)/FAD-dependent oxidoreductase [Microbacterium sp.]|uniref:FAD-dependent oxidoreductase n=1 Tax=Microbacterium sp. TaxID=51671 RepID=UPI002F947086